MGCLWLYEKWWATDNYTIFSCKNWWLYLLLSVAKWILGSYELYSIVWNTGEQLIIVRSSVAGFDKFVNCRSWYKARMRSQTIVLSAVKWISGSYEPCVRADEDYMNHAYGVDYRMNYRWTTYSCTCAIFYYKYWQICKSEWGSYELCLLLLTIVQNTGVWLMIVRSSVTSSDTLVDYEGRWLGHPRSNDNEDRTSFFLLTDDCAIFGYK